MHTKGRLHLDPFLYSANTSFSGNKNTRHAAGVLCDDRMELFGGFHFCDRFADHAFGLGARDLHGSVIALRKFIHNERRR